MRIVRMYANRKIYDTMAKAYILFQRISELIREGEIDKRISRLFSRHDISGLAGKHIKAEIVAHTEHINGLISEKTDQRVNDIMDHKHPTQRETVEQLSEKVVRLRWEINQLEIEVLQRSGFRVVSVKKKTKTG